MPFVLASLIAAAAASSAASDAMAPLAAYQGSWRAHIETLDTPYSKAGTSEVVITNDCRRWPNFVACVQAVDGKPGALLVFTYSGKPGVYASTPVLADGSVPGSGRLLVDGNVWTFPWDEKRDGAVVHFRVVNRFVSQTEIAMTREASTDGQTWTLLDRGHEVRISAR